MFKEPAGQVRDFCDIHTRCGNFNFIKEKHLGKGDYSKNY